MQSFVVRFSACYLCMAVFIHNILLFRMTAEMLKSYRLYTVGIILSCLFHVVLSVELPGCMDISEYGFALESHYHSLNAPNLAACFMNCMEDNNVCKSFTYDAVSGLCTLSSETKMTKPELFKEKENSIYMSVISVENIHTAEGSTTPRSTATSPPQETTTNIRAVTTSSSSTVTTAQTTIDQSIPTSPLITTEQTTRTSQQSTTSSSLLTTLSTGEKNTFADITSTTSPPTTTVSVNSFDQSTFCVNKAAGDYKHPDDCTKYISCVSASVIYVRDCGYTVNAVCKC